MKKLILIICFMAGVMNGFSYDCEVEGIFYNLNTKDNTASVTYKTLEEYDTKSYSYEVVIPSTIEYNGKKYSVTSIGEYAFNGCSLTSITIPNSITSIGEYAFYYCCIVSITIPNSVTTIENHAFNNCSFTSVTIGNSVKSIGDYAFYSCEGLTSVKIPDSVISIGEYAYCGCYGLKSITIGKSVTNIGDFAFDGCENMEELVYNAINANISDTYLQAIKDFGFSSAIFASMYLDKVTIGEDVLSIPPYFVSYCSSITSLTIPNSVTRIGDYAFCGLCITSLSIPNSVRSIGDYAFAECTWITSLTIGNSVTSIGNKAFFNSCFDLKSVTIPNSVISIGDEAFSDCPGLKSVTIPNSVMSIGKKAFYNCTNLKDLVYNAKNATTNATNIYESPFPSSLNKLTIGNEVESIPSFFVSICSELTSITIPNSVTSIGDYAFSDCSGLTSVAIPNSVTSIGKRSFYKCTGLKELVYNAKNATINATEDCPFPSSLINVTIGNEVESIPSYFVYGCTNLASILIPNSVTNVSSSAFEGCTNLNSVTISCKNEADFKEYIQRHDIYNVFYGGNLGDKLHIIEINGTQQSEINIPDGVISVGAYVFYKCSGLKSVSIGENVEEIGDNAFGGCSKILEIYSYPFITPTISDNCFDTKNYNNAILYVPSERKIAYANAIGWRNFVMIKEIEPDGIIEISGDSTASQTKEIFNINGQRINSSDQNKYGLIITNGKKIVLK